MRKLLGLCVPVRALMRRVSDFAHFLPDTQGFSNFGLLKIEKNTKKRRKKNARPGATGGEILYSILHYCFTHVMGIRTDRGKPFLVGLNKVPARWMPENFRCLQRSKGREKTCDLLTTRRVTGNFAFFTPVRAGGTVRSPKKVSKILQKKLLP